MKPLLTFHSVKSYAENFCNDTLHPLITLVDLNKAPERLRARLNMGIYAIILKDAYCGDLFYGNTRYDYSAGTLVFFGPGQLVNVGQDDEVYKPSGLALMFHPDLLHGTSLAKKIHEYTFFSYAVNEALHPSEKEREIFIDYCRKIEMELQNNFDKHTKTLVLSNLETLLGYCLRFYDRQFLTREVLNHGLMAKFDSILHNYFNNGTSKQLGFPSVKYVAGELNLSANYFGDLVKKETGRSAQEYIQQKLMETAKQKLCDPEKTISEVAYDMGFKYPQHFSRLFKKQAGFTPAEFRNMN